MIPRPSTERPLVSDVKFRVIDAGQMWRVLNRTDINDYKEMHYPGFNAAFGIDPNTGQHVIVYLDYYKAAYTREELEDPNSDIGRSIKDKLQKCLICSTMNQMAEDKPVVSPPPSKPQSMQVVAAPVLSPLVSSGDFVVPKYIPAVASIGQKVFCTKFGGIASSVVLSLVADLLSGWSSDPGQKAAFRQISDQFVEQMGFCDEKELEAMKGDIGRLYESWQRDGDMFKAVKNGMFKDVGQALRDQGVQVSATKNTQYSLSAGLRPRRGMSSAD